MGHDFQEEFFADPVDPQLQGLDIAGDGIQALGDNFFVETFSEQTDAEKIQNAERLKLLAQLMLYS